MGDQRTPQEVFKHHADVLAHGDIWGIVSDYADDAVFVSSDGVLRGKDGVRQAFVRLLGDVPGANWHFETVFADDVLLLRWSADSARARVADGVDTFVFRDGLIRLQTVNYTLQRKS
jgi:hypothetical protein